MANKILGFIKGMKINNETKATGPREDTQNNIKLKHYYFIHCTNYQNYDHSRHY